MFIDKKTKLSDLKKLVLENSRSAINASETEFYPYGKRLIESIQQTLAVEGYCYSLEDIYDIVRYLKL